MPFNYHQTRVFSVSLIRSGSVPLIIGAPGIGKTAMHALLAQDLKLPSVFFCPGDFEPHEVGGVLCPDGDKVRKLFSEGSPLARACREAVLLGIDEFNAQGPSKFPAMARIVNERLVGDNKLHPDTRVVCYTNSQAQSLDGNDLPLPALNRLSPIVMEYAVEDFQRFLATYGDVDSPERFYAEELSGMLDSKPDLLEVDPAKLGADRSQSFVADIVANNSTWGSPRAFEKLLKFRAELKRSKPEELTTTWETHEQEIFACIVGPRSAKLYRSMLTEGKQLPTPKEIAENPLTAKLPKTAVLGLSVASLLPAIAKLNVESAWLYVNRFDDPSVVGGADVATQLATHLRKHCPLNNKTASISVKKIQAKLCARAKVI